MDGRAVLQSFFLTGEKPTQDQFADLIQSCYNLVDDTITISMVSGLSAALAGKASAFTGAATQYVKGDGTYATLGLSDITTALSYTPENVANKSTTATLGTSDTLYPSQNAVKTYVDNALSSVTRGAISWPDITGTPTTLVGYGITDGLSAATAAATYQPLGTYLTGITGSLVTTALGYTPYNGSTNPDGYLSGISSAMISSALGYAPYNGSANPDGFISGITGSTVTAALGYTPYNGSANPLGYISANQNITLSGAVSGSGTTSIATTLANAIVGVANLAATGTASAATYLCGNGTWASPPGGVSSVTNSDGSLTISPTNGAVAASLNAAHANTFTALQSFQQNTLATGNADGMYLVNNTASTASATLQNSPSLRFRSQIWYTSGTPVNHYGDAIIYGTGTAGGASPFNIQLAFAFSNTSTGTPSYNIQATLDNEGTLITGGYILGNGLTTAGTNGLGSASSMNFTASGTSGVGYYVNSNAFLPIGHSNLGVRVLFNGITAASIPAGYSYSADAFASQPVVTASSGTHPGLYNVLVMPVGISGTYGASVTQTASLAVFGSNTGANQISIGTQNFIGLFSATNSYSASTGYGVGILNTINQTAAASFTDLLINRTNTALGSGIQYFADFQASGISKWHVDYNGNETAASLHLLPVVYANLPASPAKGTIAEVTDSAANTWGTTITGGGSYSVLAHYNGSNWTVAGV